ncbi:Adenylate and Guanylate cyclase catalytic domain containing protein [Tritrichomonas foetus]|uniref:Adenylate and Guanylate cyclase catalytic domain containing protein n=1 Tax=Tritrichomonas foetus TaxID=1144522 RepID=A0A1J4JZA8_9EUKA|nr:Adenylate and Guanylate cyclase catalytic domain containing protein [Tritrichomonas foetus]|eukprot:OHT02589.1 Adenylate and Guanylate cyclase catalytic domain containing protein [Tritrichomonas foetus]
MIDMVFPLMDNVAQHTKFPVLVTSLIADYFYLQVIFSSLWPVCFFWSSENLSPIFFKIFNILQIIFWFVEANPTKSYLTYEFIILVIICIISYGFLGYALLRYRKVHRFEKWLLYPARIVLEVVSPIMFHPAAAFTGASIKYLSANKDSVVWVFVIFGVIILVGFILLFWSGFSLSSISACMNVTHYSMFDPWMLTTLVDISSVFVTLSYVASLFPSWVFNFFQVLHICSFGFILFHLAYMPFHQLYGNLLATSSIQTSIFLDIFMIIALHVKNIPRYVPFVIILVIIIGSMIVNYFLFKYRIKTVVRNLTYTNESMTDEEKIDNFNEIGLHLSEKKALMYLRIGFAKICDMFIDWSLIRYIASVYSSNSAIAACVQILAFFPGESRQLNAFFINATSKRSLGYAHRFLIYQVHRIKTLRQSSASSDANEKLADLKRLSQQCESDINGFWIATEASFGYFEQLAAEVQALNALWLEAIRDFPNNSKFSDEYCRFLIECATDFDNAIIQKQRAELIEMGTNFSIDLSFRSMVRNYPEYLKKGILDLKGNVKSRARKKNGSTSNSSNKMSDYASTANIEIDAELENTIGKLLFRHSKLRIALHHSIKDRTLPSIDFTPLAGVFSVIIACGVFIALYVYFKITYEERGNSMNRLNYISKARLYFGLSNIAILMDFMNETGRMNNYFEMNKLMISEDPPDSVIYIGDTDYDSVVMIMNVYSRHYFTQLLNEISLLSSNGINVYDLADEIFQNIVNVTACYNSVKLKAFESNMKNLMVISYFHQVFISNADKRTLFESDNYCEILANWNSLCTATDALFRAFSNEQVSRGNDLKTIGRYIIIIVPICLFLLTSFPILLLIVRFLSIIGKFSNALNTADHSVKEKAKLPLRRDADDENIECNEPKSSKSVGNIIIFASFILSAVLTVISILMVNFANTCNDTISDLNRWEYYAALRVTLVAEGLHQTLLAVVLNSSLPRNFTTRERQTNFAMKSIANLKKYNDNLLQGTATMNPCYGVDDILDAYNIKDQCDDFEGSLEIHNIIKCASANQVIAVFSDMANDMLIDPDQHQGSIDHINPITLIHICNVHLWQVLDRALGRIVKLGAIKYEEMMNVLLALLLIGIIMSFLTLAVAIYTQLRMKLTFSTVKSLIKRLPPLHIVNNKALLNLLMNRDSIKKEEEVSVNSSIVRSNLDGILCTGLSGVVEIVNPAVTTILGYTPEQLLGQPLNVFFTEKEAEKLEKQLTLMKNGQSATTYEDHTIGVTDSTNEVHCHITILGMTNSHGEVESFVIILRDETELLLHQKEAEEAKAQSENLLFQILPRSIVTRLNQGEKDISFSVPSASILFIDIVKFSEYAAMLTPEEIMGNLSTVFAAFDHLLEKYPLVIKIKLIGDVYMAAGGLFSPEEPPQSHAEQVVRFALDCLQELDEVNVKLNANLCIRMGVNSGGPLIAGVLGTDKPVFDIIGDPINVAARLQSTDIPGRVQIPQSTYDLISGMNFEIEERGEVFLKGKGKTLAYFVKPCNIFMAQMSSSSEFKSSQKDDPTLSTSNNQMIGNLDNLLGSRTSSSMIGPKLDSQIISNRLESQMAAPPA